MDSPKTAHIVGRLPKIAARILSRFYGFLVQTRILFYRLNWLRSSHPGVPVISAGNLTAGGTGKTPLVGFLAGNALASGLKPAILSRGYGNRTSARIQRIRFCETGDADADVFGDEPCILARGNPEVPVYVSSSRIEASRLAIERDQANLLILDDAFQHLAIKRDLNLLLVDALKGFGNGRLIPRGELREPLSAMERADAVLVTRSSLGEADAVIRILREEFKMNCPVFRFDYRPRRLVRLDGRKEKDPTMLKGLKVLLTSGIAGPEGFSTVIRKLGGKPVEELVFEDHHPYPDSTLRKMKEKSEAVPHDLWVITDKDAVKLMGQTEFSEILWVLKMEVVPDPRWSSFFRDFLKKSQGSPGASTGK